MSLFSFVLLSIPQLTFVELCVLSQTLESESDSSVPFDWAKELDVTQMVVAL